jgi:PAS domain S-box-containing protein
MIAGPWAGRAEFWREVVENLGDGVAIVDAAGVKVFVNRALCTMVGYSEAELLGEPAPHAYWPEEERERITAAFHSALAGNQQELELVFKRKNGERFPVLLRPNVILAEGRLAAAAATIKDVTKQKATEQALYQSEQRWRSMAENPFDFVVTLDGHYRYTFVNHTAPGLKAEDLIGKATPFDFLDPKDHATVRQALERVSREQRSHSYEIYVPFLRRWFATIVGPILDGRQVVGYSMLTRDVTSQKEAEQALRQAQRMEALGRLAGGIAHDFNNLLVPILGNTQQVLEGLHLPADERVRLLSDVVSAGRRARELVSRILVFGREPSREPQVVNLRDLVEEVARLVQAGAPPSVQIELELDRTSPPVWGLAGELHQVVTNLCSNAVQAMEQAGGKLRITLERATLADHPSGERAASTTPRLAVRLVVADTGVGISQAILPRIFDPFFTTRPIGQGTGLGLSIVQAVVARAGGTVAVESTEGSGTRFIVVLPAAREGTEPVGSALAPGPRPTARRMRIVCIDDEPLILRWLKIALTQAGHEVHLFDDALAAEAHIRANAREIDCVLSDETMPDLTGSELATRLETSAPRVPVLLMSGYPDPAPGGPRNVRACLAKPMDTPELLAAIEAALAPGS